MAVRLGGDELDVESANICILQTSTPAGASKEEISCEVRSLPQTFVLQ